VPRNIYKLKSGEIVPGVTSITGLLGKGEGLMNWAHKVGYEGTITKTRELLDKHDFYVMPKYEEIGKWQDRRDSAGEKGTDVHRLITDFLQSKEVIEPDDKIAMGERLI
jgi:hypothetical protein